VSATIEQLDAHAAREALPELIGVLEDAVMGGASIGFLLPLSEGELGAYWESVIASVAGGNKVLLVARESGGGIVGTVQLALEPRANGAHRAEVQKLLVHRRARRQGLGRQLMLAVEQAARVAERSLLVLDTRTDDDAERLYARLGYTRLGVIPRYALNSEGGIDGSTFMYKELEALP
jgi:ribosomal protein S18 acetylase RimI-like enzyme